MTVARRTFLKGTLAVGAVGVAVGAGLLAPRRVLAARPQTAFEAKSVQDALKAVVGTDLTEASGKVKVKAPDIAENGAVVPVTVTAALDGVEAMAIFVEKNPQPLTSSYELSPAALGFVSTRIKMGKTSDVIAVAKAGGKVYSARKEVKVTIGGCGG